MANENYRPYLKVKVTQTVIGRDADDLIACNWSQLSEEDRTAQNWTRARRCRPSSLSAIKPNWQCHSEGKQKEKGRT